MYGRKFFIFFGIFNYFLYIATNVLKSILSAFKGFFCFCHMDISKIRESSANAILLYFFTFFLHI